MKKRSLFIVVAMVLLLAVVLGMGGTTFAKYIKTQETESNSATVARWGWILSVENVDGLFGEKYNADGEVDANGEAIVSATSSQNVIAPGANGSFTFAINGWAEVLTEITISADGDDVILYNGTGEGKTEVYRPLVWTLTKEGVVSPLATGSLETVVAAVEGLSTVVDAADQTPDICGTYTVSYAWDFDAAGVGTNDTNDTLLGYLAAGGEAATKYANGYSADLGASF